MIYKFLGSTYKKTVNAKKRLRDSMSSEDNESLDSRYTSIKLINIQVDFYVHLFMPLHCKRRLEAQHNLLDGVVLNSIRIYAILYI